MDGYDISCGVTKKLSENARLKRLVKLVRYFQEVSKRGIEEHQVSEGKVRSDTKDMGGNRQSRMSDK